MESKEWGEKKNGKGRRDRNAEVRKENGKMKGERKKNRKEEMKKRKERERCGTSRLLVVRFVTLTWLIDTSVVLD